jgi:hypothetical protein
MENTHTLEDVQAFITIKIDNNPSSVISVLNMAGYKVAVKIGRSELALLLRAIYDADKAKFVKMLNSVPYNESANNYTTSPTFTSKVEEVVKSKNISNKSNGTGGTMQDFMQSFGDLIGGSTQTQSTTTNTKLTGSLASNNVMGTGLSAGSVVGISIGAVAVLATIIVVVVKSSK